MERAMAYLVDSHCHLARITSENFDKLYGVKWIQNSVTKVNNPDCLY